MSTDMHRTEKRSDGLLYFIKRQADGTELSLCTYESRESCWPEWSDDNYLAHVYRWYEFVSRFWGVEPVLEKQAQKENQGMTEYKLTKGKNDEHLLGAHGPDGSRVISVPAEKLEGVRSALRQGNWLYLEDFIREEMTAYSKEPDVPFALKLGPTRNLLYRDNDGPVELPPDQVDDVRKMIESKDTVLLEKFWAIKKANEWLSSQPPAVSGQCGQSTARTVLSDYLSRVPSDADPVMVWSNICKWNQKNFPPFEQLDLLTLSGFERWAVTAKGREVCETARKASRKYWAPKWPVVTADCPLSKHTTVVTTDASGAQKKVYAKSANFDKGTVEAVFTTDKGDRVTWTTDKARLCIREDAPDLVKRLFPEIPQVNTKGMPRAQAEDLLPTGTCRLLAVGDRQRSVAVRIGEDPVRVQELFGPRLRGFESLLPKFYEWMNKETLCTAEAAKAVPEPEKEALYRRSDQNPWNCQVVRIEDRKGSWVLLRAVREQGSFGPANADKGPLIPMEASFFEERYCEWEGGLS